MSVYGAFQLSAKKETSPKVTAVRVVLRPSVRYPATPGQFTESLRGEDDLAREEHQVQGRTDHGNEGPSGQLACPAGELDLHHQIIKRRSVEQRKGRGATPAPPLLARMHPSVCKVISPKFTFRSLHVPLGIVGRKPSALRCQVGDHKMSGSRISTRLLG
jgi:hypothetical protein